MRSVQEPPRGIIVFDLDREALLERFPDQIARLVKADARQPRLEIGPVNRQTGDLSNPPVCDVRLEPGHVLLNVLLLVWRQDDRGEGCRGSGQGLEQRREEARPDRAVVVRPHEAGSIASVPRQAVDDISPRRVVGDEAGQRAHDAGTIERHRVSRSATDGALQKLAVSRVP